MSVRLASLRRWLDGRWPVVVAGALSALAVGLVWGGLRPVPVMHDEWAYWLQADQYAHAHWNMAAPALPEFFEQFYVLVMPVFAAKYPPGHALTMAPGFLLGLPALMPLLLTGLTGALVVALARRVAAAPVAVLTWTLWISTFGNLRFRAAYFSELTTSCCWLLAWWALLEWRAHAYASGAEPNDARGTRWMIALAAVIGWGAITRPATMFVFAIPVAVVVIRDIVRRGRWRDGIVGVVVGLLVLGILPLWSAETTGNWRVNPLAVYTRQYLPFDIPGYHVNETAPERTLPPEMERTRTFLHDIKTEQADMPVWKTARDRVTYLLTDAFGGWRLPFAAAFMVGICFAGPAGWFALGTSVLLILGYLAQAHTADWTIYYLETLPVVAFIAALGTRVLAQAVARRGLRLSANTGLVLAAGAAVLLAADVGRARQILARIAAKPRRFTQAVAQLPHTPNIVFVRYAEGRNRHIALVANAGRLDAAASWIVHDRGDENRKLMAVAPERTAYLFDEASGEFRVMTP